MDKLNYDSFKKLFEEIGVKLNPTINRRDGVWIYQIWGISIHTNVRSTFNDKSGSSTILGSSNLSPDDALKNLMDNCSKKEIFVKEYDSENEYDHGFLFNKETNSFTKRKLKGEEANSSFY